MHTDSGMTGISPSGFMPYMTVASLEMSDEPYLVPIRPLQWYRFADIINKGNRKLLKDLGIVCHCPPLGRPKKNPDPEEEQLRRKASGERNSVEATFGTAKRVYRANNIKAKLKETAQTWIAACFFAKNLKKFLSGLLCLLLEKVLRWQQFHNNIIISGY